MMNSKLISDSESPQNIDETLSKFSDPSFVSCLDYSSSFWQIYLHPESRDITSFNFEGHNYRFTRVPFGTKVSMQMFIKASYLALGPEVDDFISQYVDDLRVVSKNFEEHLEHLVIIFQKLIAAGFTLKFSKCKFVQETVEFLGHLISRDGIQMDPQKVEAVQKFPTPKSVKDLQSFLGLVNFYKKFSMQHAELCRPLFDLLKKNSVWHWDDHLQAAFDKVKRIFIDDVMLAYPCFDKEFFLNTDASLNAVSGELFQYDNDEMRRPIAFFSRVLQAPEKNYFITELELLAIVNSCEKFRQYILGYPITVLTDHHALTFLNRCVLSHGRLTRWSLYLQEYNLKVKYIKGSDNVAADILSRYPPQVHNLPPTNLEINVFVARKPIISHLDLTFQELLNSQQNDPFFGKIYNKLKEGGENRSKYVIHNNILFFKQKDDDNWRLCIPGSIENKIITHAHERIGHFGAEKTYKFLKLFVFFPSLEKKTRQVTSACILCQRCKAPNINFRAPLTPIVADKFLQIVSVDLFGPLPTSVGNVQNILVCLDVYSKYVKLYAIRRATGSNVTRKFMNKYVNEVGKPLTVVADRGPCFRSNVWEQQLKEIGVTPGHSSVYYPQGNPVERYMRSLGNLCRIYCHDKHKSWASYLPFFEQCLNTTHNSSTGCIPYEIIMKKPINNYLQSVTPFPTPITPIDFESKLQLLEKTTQRKADLRKKNHDKNTNLCSFKVGDRVLIKMHHLSNAAYGETKKFFCLFDGPYVISAAKGRGVFKVKDPDTDQLVGVYNTALLRPAKSIDQF